MTHMLGFPESRVSYINGVDWFVSALFWSEIVLFIVCKTMSRKVFYFLNTPFLVFLFLVFLKMGKLDLWGGRHFLLSDGFYRAWFDINLGLYSFYIYKFFSAKDIFNNLNYSTRNLLYCVISTIAFCFAIMFSKFHSGRTDFILLFILDFGIVFAFNTEINSFGKIIKRASTHTYAIYLNQGFLTHLLINGLGYKRFNVRFWYCFCI